MTPYRFRDGSGPLVVSMPHVGSHIPDEIADAMTAAGRSAKDADWNVDRLYAFLDEADATVIAATHSRFVVDLNRSPEGGALYPGRFETGLLPGETFEGELVYLAGREPGEAERARRIERYWRPYHDRLAAALEAAKARHGRALLLDAHSIRAVSPKLFEGRLPDVNVGTNDGRSCDSALTAALREVLQAQDRFSWVIDGRFKGGWITRHYGRPAENVHAVQFELVQAAYMDESDPAAWDEARAEPLRALLRALVRVLRAFAPSPA